MNGRASRGGITPGAAGRAGTTTVAPGMVAEIAGDGAEGGKATCCGVAGGGALAMEETPDGIIIFVAGVGVTGTGDEGDRIGLAAVGMAAMAGAGTMEAVTTDAWMGGME